MFLRYYVVVDRPFEEVEAEFLKGAEHWMPGFAAEANGHGARLLSELGFQFAKHRVSRRIELELGPPRQTERVMLMSVKWHAAENSPFFPILDGQLELAMLGIATTQLGLSATYEPPFAVVGRIADRAMLHRVAEITVKDFLERTGTQLAKQRPKSAR